MLDPLAKAVARGLAPVEVRPSRCARTSRVRTVRTDCRACAEICPHGAIALDPLRIDPDRCDGCGICVGACASAALTEGSAFRQSLVDSWRRSAPGQPFVLTCGQADLAAGENGCAVPCLASTRWPSAAIPALLGASCVELRRGDCGACRLGAARPAIEATRELVEQFVPAAGLDAEVRSRDSAGASANPVSSRRLSRRALFGSLARRSRTVAAELAGELSRQASVDEAGHWAQDLVARLLTRRPPPRGRLSVARGLIGRPVADAIACTICGLCVPACPTTALGSTADALWLEASRCVGCGRCEDACPEAALDTRAPVQLAAWAAGPTQIAQRVEHLCHACGERPARIPTIGLCDRCQCERRGVGIASRRRGEVPPR